MTILDRILESTKARVTTEKQAVSLEEMKARAAGMNRGFCFAKALSQDGMSFICEVKKASPSKGLIAEQFPYVEIAQVYEAAGASAISVLTEPEFFLGSNRYLEEIRTAVSIPLLRKDFIVDAYQIYQAAAMGADAVLLICAALDAGTLSSFLQLAHSFGMDVLVEAHDADEVQTAISIGANIIGVNNRNLKDFSVDFSNSLSLRHLAPDKTLFVAESGIQSREDVLTLEQGKVDAVLVGETLMRAPNIGQALAALKGDAV